MHTLMTAVLLRFAFYSQFYGKYRIRSIQQPFFLHQGVWLQIGDVHPYDFLILFSLAHLLSKVSPNTAPVSS
jgi:hypothetical protein